jgi:hypothetical protein
MKTEEDIVGEDTGMVMAVIIKENNYFEYYKVYQNIYDIKRFRFKYDRYNNKYYYFYFFILYNLPK